MIDPALLSPGATATKPYTATIEPVRPRGLFCTARETTTKRGPCTRAKKVLTIEENPHSNADQAQPKRNIILAF